MRRRWLKRSLWALVALEAAYLVVGNFFLHPAVGPDLLARRPEKILIDWSGGWTVVPGLLHLEDFRLRTQNRKQRWALELERVRARIALSELPRRCFRLRGASGEGLRFLLRPRPAMDAASAEEVSGLLPVIEGFAAGDAVAPERPRAKKPWRIVLEKLAIERVGEIWIRHHRYRGGGRLEGELDLLLRGALSVRGARLDLEAGEILQGETVVGELEELAATLEVDPFMPREHRGLAALRFFSGTLAFDAPKADLDLLDFFTRGNHWLDVGGHGEVWCDMGLDRGRLVPESRLRSSADLRVDYLDYHLAGYGHLDVEVAEVEGAVENILYATFEDFALGAAGAAEPHVFGRGAEVKISSRDLDLSRPSREIRAVIDLPESEVPRLAHYNRFLPAGSGIAIEQGSGSLRAHLELSTASSRVRGEMEVSGQGVEVRFGDLRAAGDLDLHTLIPDGHIGERRFDLSGTRLEIENASLAAGESSSDSAGWWARIALPAGQVELGQPMQLTAVLQATIRDTGPFVSLLERDKQRPAWLRNLLTVEDVSALGRLAVREKAVRVGDLDVRGRKLRLLGHLRFAEEDLGALLYCKFHGLSAAVEMMGGKRDWDLVGSRRWFERKESTWEPDPVDPEALAAADGAAWDAASAEGG